MNATANRAPVFVQATGAASRDPALMAEIRTLLLKHKALFFRDQDISRAEHGAFA
jgi:taurine dioxygenase